MKENRFPFRSTLLACVLAILIILSCLGCRKKKSNPSESEFVSPEIEYLLSSPTPSPAPIPTPEPESQIEYLPDPSHPLPNSDHIVSLGKAYQLGGTIQSNYPLTSVRVMIICDYNEDPRYPYERSVSFLPSEHVYSYNLADPSGISNVSLDSMVHFSDLMVGHHTILISASNTKDPYEKSIISSSFLILGSEWKQFTKSDFSNNSYASALAFFKKPERFLYRYQQGWWRYTIADPAWERKYITDFIMDEGDPWRVHIDAVPYYTLARQYLYSVHLRVHGTNGDTGVLPLHRLIEGYFGTYLSRFTSSLKSISHHALGTASDINAHMEPNQNNKENIALIHDDVKRYLAYDGIEYQDEIPYYSFTYSGSYPNSECGIPQTCINYLLYELAFFRAGFEWGHYYNTTSDGMHFTLTDNIKNTHDSSSTRGLRKVFEYSESY